MWLFLVGTRFIPVRGLFCSESRSLYVALFDAGVDRHLT
jgi:hypothetical protein